jgi:hypothetical protein
LPPWILLSQRLEILSGGHPPRAQYPSSVQQIYGLQKVGNVMSQSISAWLPPSAVVTGSWFQKFIFKICNVECIKMRI